LHFSGCVSPKDVLSKYAHFCVTNNQAVYQVVDSIFLHAVWNG
jgi:bisphosphoglycerate-independent phosphoglycerate mutase (AlkP superfamily)